MYFGSQYHSPFLYYVLLSASAGMFDSFVKFFCGIFGTLLMILLSLVICIPVACYQFYLSLSFIPFFMFSVQICFPKVFFPK